MHRILLTCGLLLALVSRVLGADVLTLTDGTSHTGDIIKFDDNGLMLHEDGERYTALQWSQLSQDTLKTLAQDPKKAPMAEPFIEPTTLAKQPSASAIQINPVTRLERPANPSVLGGFAGSSVGKVVLVILYLANLYAAFEVALIRNRPLFQVLGLSAVVPVIVPAIFAYLPVVLEKPPEEVPMEGALPEKVAMHGAPTEIEVEAEAIAAAVKQAQAQVFARGKFTFNKRFIETKFAGFVGEPKGDGLKFTMTLKTTKEVFSVERIAQVGAGDALLETKERGQVTVAFTEIQEIKLNPIPA